MRCHHSSQELMIYFQKICLILQETKQKLQDQTHKKGSSKKRTAPVAEIESGDESEFVPEEDEDNLDNDSDSTYTESPVRGMKKRRRMEPKVAAARKTSLNSKNRVSGGARNRDSVSTRDSMGSNVSALETVSSCSCSRFSSHGALFS